MSTFRQKVQAKTDWGKPDSEEEAQASAKRPGKSAPKARRASPSPVTAHRLFPAFSALWFAALFGLGSLAIPSEVLGRLVTATGLPALVPAAAPPLGFTAHFLVALVLTVVGATLGLFIGLRLRPQTADTASPLEAAASVAEAESSGVPKVRARDAHPDAPPRRPLVLTEAFGDPVSTPVESLPSEDPLAPEGPLLRRKPVQAEADEPLSEPGIFIPVLTPGGVVSDEPLDLGALDILVPQDSDNEAGPFGAPAPLAALELDREAATAADAQAEPQMEQATETVAAPAATPLPVPVLIAATPQVPGGFALPRPSAEQIEAGEPWSPVADTPLADLGLVQLIERLALAMSAHKAAREAGPLPPTDGLTAEPAVIEAESEPDAQVMSVVVTPPDAPFAKPAHPAPSGGEEPMGSAREAIMRRLGAVASPRPAFVQSADGPAAFSRPAQIDPVIAFHVQPTLAAQPAPPAPVVPLALPESDEALRSALATLQRMSARG